PQVRVSSPLVGSSILMTSAPRSARSMAQYGPASTRDRSTIRTPASGPGPAPSSRTSPSDLPAEPPAASSDPPQAEIRYVAYTPFGRRFSGSSSISGSHAEFRRLGAVSRAADDTGRGPRIRGARGHAPHARLLRGGPIPNGADPGAREAGPPRRHHSGVRLRHRLHQLRPHLSGAGAWRHRAPLVRLRPGRTLHVSRLDVRIGEAEGAIPPQDAPRRDHRLLRA